MSMLFNGIAITPARVAALAGGNGGNGGNGAASYLLRATWDGAADQGYTDGQVLDTEGEGVEDGQLTVVEADGSLDVVGNKAEFTAPSSAGHGELGAWSNFFTSLLGLGFITDMLSDGNVVFLGFLDVADLDAAQDVNFKSAGGNRFQISPRSSNIFISWGTVASFGVGLTITANEEYQYAFVLGGHDGDNGAVYYSGQTRTAHMHGGAVYIKGGTEFPSWTLLHRLSRSRLDKVYFGHNAYDTNGHLDDLLVPETDLSAVLEPIDLWTFDGEANGASLDATSPAVGAGSWLEESGDWEIQSEKAQTAGTSGAGAASFDCGETDLLLSAHVTIPAGGLSAHCGLAFRLTDGSNYWYVRLNSNGNFQMGKVVSGVYNGLTNTSNGWTAGETYLIQVYVKDNDHIRGYVDGVQKWVHSASDTFNENATEVGIVDEGDANAAFDQIAVWPLTSSVYTDRLDLTTTTDFPASERSITDLSDDFDDNQIDWARYSEYNEGGTVAEQNQQLEMSSPGAQHVQLDTQEKWRLTGDFDVQVDFSGYGGGWACLDLHSYYYKEGGGKPQEEARVMRQSSGGDTYGFEVRTGGVPSLLDGSGTYVATTDTSGKFRVTRTGNTVEGFYWDGSQWVSIDTGTVDGAVDMSIMLWVTEGGDVDFDNLVMNSGTVVEV